MPSQKKFTTRKKITAKKAIRKTVQKKSVAKKVARKTVQKKTTKSTAKKAARKKVAAKPTAKKASPKNPDWNALAMRLHKKLGGKIGTLNKGALETREDWSTMYTPGVAAVSQHLSRHPEDARIYTVKKNTVAVISDGSAVLGLGNVGPVASLPVMEGKCAIFKAMGNVDAVPVVLDAKTPDDIVAAVAAIAPTYGGINLEDIGAPVCFEVEERLKDMLDIPVFHDDQHGTAIVVLAGLINAAKVVQKKLHTMKIVVVGAGAAGAAIANLLTTYGIKNVIVTDSRGIIHRNRPSTGGYKNRLAQSTNPEGFQGELHDAVKGADAIVGVSGPGTIAPVHVEVMAERPIVFALANPISEIKPEDAVAAGAAVVATGRSDFPNQVNNSLVFPGIFRGALDRGVTAITDEMKIAAAEKVAARIKKPTAGTIIPSVNDKGLMKAVASAVR